MAYTYNRHGCEILSFCDIYFIGSVSIFFEFDSGSRLLISSPFLKLLFTRNLIIFFFPDLSQQIKYFTFLNCAVYFPYSEGVVEDSLEILECDA